MGESDKANEDSTDTKTGLVSDTSNEGSTNAHNGSIEQSVNYLRTVREYREGVRNLSKQLMKISWHKLKSTSSEFITVDTQLRDTILTLEDLEEDTEDDAKDDRIDMTAILKALNEALKELSGVAILADREEQFVEDHLEALDKIGPCREYLALAVSLMKVPKGIDKS
jgi:hypothetical protein